MNEHEALKILKEVRKRYRAGYGSSDKRYDMEHDRVRRKIKRTQKAQFRNKLSEFAEVYLEDGEETLIEKINETEKDGLKDYVRYPLAGNAHEMSVEAATTAANREHKAYLLYIGKLHICCAVDYEPNEDSVDAFRHMSLYKRKEAYIIDPWMNISCRFSEYSSAIEPRLFRWQARGKLIRRNSEWIRPMAGTFFGLFRGAQLRFKEVPPQRDPSRWLTTKYARNIRSPDSV